MQERLQSKYNINLRIAFVKDSILRDLPRGR